MATSHLCIFVLFLDRYIKKFISTNNKFGKETAALEELLELLGF